MKGRKSKSWAMAYCGMAAALSVALMLLGAVVSHCDVHCSGGGQLPHRHSLRGVREDHGSDGRMAR